MVEDNNRPHFVSRATGDMIVSKDYALWLAELKQNFRSCQAKAAVRVNSAMLEFYWHLGRDIFKLQAEIKWGSAFFENLSLDLRKEFPDQKGFSVTNLKYIKRWYLFYQERLEGYVRDEDEIRHQVGDELYRAVDELFPIRHQPGDGLEMPESFALVPWRQHVEIFTKSKQLSEAIFYIQQSIANDWGRDTLMKKMNENLFFTLGKAVTNFDNKLPEQQANAAKAVLKDPYHFGFLRLKEKYSEQDLEDALMQNITRFLLELGHGFAFVGRQMELRMTDGKSFFPDLVFYHFRQKRFVVVELKIDEFVPEYAGKINFYVNAADKLLKGKDDNPSVGLLICRNANKAIVEWSFQGVTNPIGVATYELEEVVTRTINGMAIDVQHE